MNNLEAFGIQTLLCFFLVLFFFAGSTLEIITDRSQEGSQFCKGFGGIGGILRYRVDFQQMELDDNDFNDFDDY